MSHPTIIAYPLRRARVHEVSGPAAASFALRFAQLIGTNVLWIRERWRNDHLHPPGMDGFDPSRLITATTKDQTDTLAVAEEALRDGSFGLVVSDITAPLGLTAGRRLQLAAKAGSTTGLCQIPNGMGSNAAETRWQCAPVFSTDSTLQRWDLIKNKSGTTGSWHVRWDAKTRRIFVVPPSGERSVPARAPD